MLVPRGQGINTTWSFVTLQTVIKETKGLSTYFRLMTQKNRFHSRLRRIQM